MKIKDFYLFAMIIFTVVGLGSSYSLFVNYSHLDIGAIVSSIANILFSFVVAYFMFHLRKQQLIADKSSLQIEQLMNQARGQKNESRST